ncbi:GtrA family protein [Pallidibacillus pasinlerensis]|uniref:GtrA family protein n=1 Tax=Pallidibacillus pasinlerensis TaxID=2703818 RepID=A0ABW9ZYL6_9BACI|nr:GtrA family protein [Pallidibacillus pasinlerensis]NCU16264.1 GtrA family protein [Pallidibacillus pasinlerensis]
MKVFAKFGFVGIFNTIITICTYIILVHLGVYYIFANIIGYILGVINSFYWNKNWVFQVTDRKNHLFLKFVIVNLITLIVNNIVLYALVNYLSIGAIIAQIFATGVGMVLNFFLNKLWTFK